MLVSWEPVMMVVRYIPKLPNIVFLVASGAIIYWPGVFSIILLLLISIILMLKVVLMMIVVLILLLTQVVVMFLSTFIITLITLFPVMTLVEH